MPEFHNPYQFVPVVGRIRRDGRDVTPQTVDYEELAAGISDHPARHDRWLPGTRSGRILCRLILERPTLVGSRQESDDGQPTEVQPYTSARRHTDGKPRDWPAIPGSSLRGMIASAAETLSQSSLRVVENRAYSVRTQLPPREGCPGALSALGRLRKHATPAEDGSEFELIPLSLPTIELKGGAYKLGQSKWNTAFKRFTWEQGLTAYVDGYKKVELPTGDVAVQLDVNSFLAQSGVCNDARCYAMLEGAPTPMTKVVTEPLPQMEGLKLKAAGRRTFLLGRNLSRCYTEADYQQLKALHQKILVPGRLRVLGVDDLRSREMPPTKKHELFIPDQSDKPVNPLPVPQHVIDTFTRLARERHEANAEHPERPPLPFSLRSSDHWEPQDGDLFFFDVSEDGTTVTEIAISSVWRRKTGPLEAPGFPTAYDYFDKVAPDKTLTPLRPGRGGLTPAELLLGVVDEQKQKDASAGRALASRVRVYDAISRDEPKRVQAPITLKILDSPKPPSTALYFRNRDGSGGYIARCQLDPAKHAPNGRKVYLHHRPEGFQGKPEHWNCSSRVDDGRDHQRLRCQPLLPAEDNPFWFHIDFDNLTDGELTLLLTALRPANVHRHKLGLGKSLGLGTVRIDIAGVFLVDRQARYGLDALKQPRYHSGWTNAAIPAEQWRANYPAAIAGQDDEWLAGTNPDQCGWWQPDLVDEPTLAVVRTLGDPDRVRPGVPVVTPLTNAKLQALGANPAVAEEKTFEWFVHNDDPRKLQQVLPPVEPDADLPTLQGDTPRN